MVEPRHSSIGKYLSKQHGAMVLWQLGGVNDYFDDSLIIKKERYGLQ
jgi:hypothetical protein